MRITLLVLIFLCLVGCGGSAESVNATATFDALQKAAAAELSAANFNINRDATPLPLVKQGAPGQRDGIGGDIFTFAGLQSQVDPAIYGDRITFMLGNSFDADVGTGEGDGVARVDFEIVDASGRVVHESTDWEPRFCAFGGGAPECDLFSFRANGWRWPNGVEVSSGQYDVTVRATGTNPASTAVWEYAFELDLSEWGR